MTQSFSIVSANLTVEALRDSGYKSTDHALSELIDNSVDAKANRVEVVAVESLPDPTQAYARSKINKIAVIDDGVGMDAVTLRRALRFGDGTHRDHRSRAIGRFGVGLPQSSVSQCRRVDIWTWTQGSANALWCYLDLDEISKDDQQDVPEPMARGVPDIWCQVSSNISNPTGTLVVWSNLDRVRWSGGSTTLQHTAEHCGRVYRKFLETSRSEANGNSASADTPEAVGGSTHDKGGANDKRNLEIILTLAVYEDDQIKMIEEKQCLPNDPLYLMYPSATPEPFAKRPMFKEYNVRNFPVHFKDHEGNLQTSNVKVQCTMALPEAINREIAQQQGITWPSSAPKAGSTDWGKHAEKNKGVSIVRSGRELELSINWINNHQPEERWWAVEVEFDPILDEMFGVVNSKQHAHGFNQGADFDWTEERNRNQGETYEQFRDRLKEMGDAKGHLSEIWDWITDQIKRMRKLRENLMTGTGPNPLPERPEVEAVATSIIENQQNEGDTGDSITDSAPEITPESKVQEIVDSITQYGIERDVARLWAQETVDKGRRVLIKGVPLSHGYAFFDVKSVNDVIEVLLNEQHPAFDHIFQILNPSTESPSIDVANGRLQKVLFALRMLLIAWARYEDKSPAGMKQSIIDSRMDWGKEARKFLNEGID